MQTETPSDAGNRIAAQKIGPVSIEVFGKPDDWRLAPSDVLNSDAIARVASVMRVHGTQTCYNIRPTGPDFSALIGAQESFDTLYENHDESQRLRILHQKGVDGVEITPRQSTFIASADCPTLVLASEYRAIVAHCARGCLLKGMVGQANVIENAFNALFAEVEPDDREEFLQTVTAHIVAGISAPHFVHSTDHPKYGEANREMISYIRTKWGPDCIVKNNSGECIDLNWIIRQALLSTKLRPGNISSDGLCTFENEDLWSHCAGDEKRNGVLVHFTG